MRNIVLKRGSVAVYDDGTPFLAEFGELSLCFTLPDPNGDYFAVTGKKKYAIGKDGRVSIPVEPGELCLAVKRYIGGRLVESYAVEPLEIKSVDGNATAFPEISTLQKQVVELTKASEAQAKFLCEEETAHRKWQARAAARAHRGDVAFLSYSWAEYQSDVQLNAKSLSLAAFMTSLGFCAEEFTAEEIKKIETFKEEV